jgi:uncharacterized protein (DUF1499 family)
MHRKQTMLMSFAIAAGALTAGLRLYMGSAGQDRLEPDEHLDLVLLRDPHPGPSFLACPPHYCRARAGMAPPTFAIGWRQLRALWVTMLATKPRVVTVSTELEGRRLIHIEHSPVFRFPDIVTVEFMPVGPESSTLAVFSRSRYGRNDFDQNRKRVESWLGELEKTASPASVTRVVSPRCG